MKIAFWNDETGRQDERDMTSEEIAEFTAMQNGEGQTFEVRNAAILAQLAELDAKSIRPLREGDAARVAALEEEAETLRAQLVK